MSKVRIDDVKYARDGNRGKSPKDSGKDARCGPPIPGISVAAPYRLKIYKRNDPSNEYFSS